MPLRTVRHHAGTQILYLICLDIDPDQDPATSGMLMFPGVS